MTIWHTDNFMGPENKESRGNGQKCVQKGILEAAYRNPYWAKLEL